MLWVWVLIWPEARAFCRMPISRGELKNSGKMVRISKCMVPVGFDPGRNRPDQRVSGSCRHQSESGLKTDPFRVVCTVVDRDRDHSLKMME